MVCSAHCAPVPDNGKQHESRPCAVSQQWQAAYLQYLLVHLPLQNMLAHHSQHSRPGGCCPTQQAAPLQALGAQLLHIGQHVRHDHCAACHLLLPTHTMHCPGSCCAGAECLLHLLSLASWDGGVLQRRPTGLCRAGWLLQCLRLLQLVHPCAMCSSPRSCWHASNNPWQ